ncbi:IclR family transcriptional regulator [Georgenia sp. AZ-5]|uniref:IclR family transcriptional regulator n=1 Tax=Georgenia sp. AZ-5 TaxID=3367526 RepID=UPI0037547DCE
MTSTKRPRSGGGLESVHKAMAILHLIHERGSVRGFEAAEHFGVARSTAHRLLTAMRQQGFVEKSPTGHEYVLGPAIRSIAAGSMTRTNIRSQVQRHLDELATTTGETTTFMVLEGNGVRFAAGSESPSLVRVVNRVGILLPAHATSGGKALLAELSDEQLRALYPRGFATITARTLNSIDSLIDEMHAIRARGYAVNAGESENGVAAIAVVVRGGGRRKAIGALSIAAPAERMPEGRVPGVVARLKHGAGSLSESLR